MSAPSRRRRPAQTRTRPQPAVQSDRPPRPPKVDRGGRTDRVRGVVLERADVLRLRALLALRDVELHALVLLQRLVALPLDRAEVAEDVGAAVVLRDEAEALLRVEPLHCSLCHVLIVPLV